MPLTLPQFPPVAGQKAKASQVAAWWAALIARFNGGINSTDMAPNAGVTGSQLSSASGTRITAPNLEDGAVINRVLKADATAGRLNAAVKKDNIVDGEIVTAHLASGAVLLGKIKTTTFDWAVNTALGVKASNSLTTGLLSSAWKPQVVSIRKNGVIIGDNCLIIFGLYENTATGTYFLFVGNPTDQIRDYTGVTIRAEFIGVT